MQAQLYSRILWLTIFHTTGLILLGQSSLLNQKVSIELHDRPLEIALEEIGRVGGFAFSYNPHQFPLHQKINLSLKRVSIEQVLDTILTDNSIQYREIGNHIILKKRKTAPTSFRSPPSPQPPDNPIPSYLFSGQVRDFSSKNLLADASISIAQPDQAVVTDAEGRFSIRLTTEQSKIDIQIRHRYYQSMDTTIDLKETKSIKLELIPNSVDPLNPLTYPLTTSAELNPVADVFLVRLLINEVTLTEAPTSNFRHSPAQLTLINPAGTNRLKAGRTINHVSINLIAGYSAGLAGVEFGGVLNAVRYDVHGVQFAGVGNVVGGRSNGLQMAGVLNINQRSVQGFQFAGVYNLADSLRKGGQVSGVFNMLKGELKGSQISGVLNHARKVDGLQLGGAVNISSGRVRGTQISGLFNYANIMQGVQIAPFNYADSLQGIPIGFLSLVRRNGLKQVTLSSSEFMPLQLSFKTGSHHFYNIFSFGINPISGRKGWSYGYGLGSKFYLRKRHALQTELSVSQINTGLFKGHSEFNMLNQLHLAWSIPVGHSLYFDLGPTANLLFSDPMQDSPGGEYPAGGPYTIYQSVNGSTRMQFWVGGKIALAIGGAIGGSRGTLNNTWGKIKY